MKTKKILFGSTLLAAAAMSFCATSAAFAGSVTGPGDGDTYTDDKNGGSTTIGTVEKTYQRSMSGYWTGVSITTTGTVEGYELTVTGADSNGTYTSDQDLYFVGTSTDGSDSLTITDLTVENGEGNGKYYGTTHAFIVEGCTVILSGVTVDELGMSLSIGTEYQAGTGTLVITNQSSVTTGAYLNTIGSNLNTGIVTIEKGSTLATQQFTIGAGVDSLISGGTPDGSYQPKCFYTQETYEDVVRAALVSGKSFEGSYGVVNVKSGSTFSVGVGNTDYSINKFQLSNGELNVSGADSQMIIGDSSKFLVMGEWAFANSNAAAGEYGLFAGIVYNEKINVTDGGKITNEEGKTLSSLYLGEDYLAANTTVKISVSGSDDNGNASSFDLTSSSNAHIGTLSGYSDSFASTYGITDGGTMDVTISASEGGEFKITANGIFVCADNYETYLVSGGSEKTVGHSYGIGVKLSAESGGSLELNSVSGGTVLLAAGSPAEGEYKNTLTITADGTSTDDDGTTTASSITISGGDIYTNFGDAGEGSDNVYVTITATNGGTIALSAAAVDEVGTGVISFGMNTAVTVEENSSLTTEGTSVSFESGSSLIVNAGASWTSNGSVTVAEGASMNLNGTIDLSNQIQNSGEVTVGEDVVFVLREDDENFKDEDTHFNFTYDFIINTEADETTQTTGGTIEGWDSLTIDNFSIVGANGNDVPDNLGIVTKADGQATVVFVTTDETNGGTATVDYDYYIEYASGRSDKFSGKFYCIGITVDGTVDSFVLQDRTSITGDLDDITKAITDKDVLFIGSGATDSEGNLVDSVTITSMNIDNGTTTSGFRETSYYAFAVEGCTVIIDGQASEHDGTSQIVISDLGMSLNIGTMYGAGDAELIITNGSSITTKDCYNTIGSNLNTGTVTIEEGSTLTTQQITLGGGVNSLFAAGEVNGQYRTLYFYDSDTYADTVRAKIVSGDSLEGISYGIVNVESGSTFSVGVGNTSVGYNKFQLSNGELNVSGAGSQMIIGDNSKFLVMGEWAFANSGAAAGEYGLFTGICYTEKINVTDGGKITNEADTGLSSLYLGEDYLAANTNVEISVSGSDDNGNASSFDLTSSSNAHIGTLSGYSDSFAGTYGITDGGTMDVTISASEGGEFKITANGIFVCADNYETYLVSGGDQKDVGHSYGIDVKLSATDGGSIELNSVSGGTVLLAAGSPKTEEGDDGNNAYTNTLTITADGTSTDDDGTTTASSITISGGDIYTNFGDAGEGSDNVYVTITAKNGGEITLSAEADEVTEQGSGIILFNKNTAVSVDKDSSLTLSGAVTLAEGATMDLAGTETIDALDSQGAITVSDGTLSAKSISVTKDAGSGETDGVLTIKGGETTVETLTIGAEDDVGGSLSMSGGTLNVTWTASDEVQTGGFSIASSASASFSGGTVNVSTAIANDGSVTVNGDVVFVLNDSLKVEGTSATYAIIINGEGGKITGWQTLGTANFTYSNSALDTNVVLDLTTDGYVTLLYTEDGVTINYDYAVPWQRGVHGLLGYDPTNEDKQLYYFRAMHIEIDEGASVGGFTLQDLTNEEGDYAITGKNVYITGKADSDGNYSSKLTITSAKIDNGEAKNSYSTQDSFIVEGCTVVFDGKDINIAELGMNLSIGTKADATLEITNGAKVRTGAYLNTVGANLATGTITISGEGSLLDNQQITLGAATNSEFGISGTYAEDGEYWIQFVETEEEYQAVIAAIASDGYDPTKDGSYGIVNVLDGATWQVGVGNSESSNSRIQLSNGEINIDGGSVILGNSSTLAITGENLVVIEEGDTYTYATGINYSQSITITNGGSLSAYEGGTIHALTIGQIWYASNDTVSISVDGEGSSFVVAAADVEDSNKKKVIVGIGYNAGTWSGGTYTDGYGNAHTIDTVTIDGGSEKIDITASNGGVISISAENAIGVAYEAGTKGSYGIDVSLLAETGGSITLAANQSNSTALIYFGRGSAATADGDEDGENDYQNSVSVKATGEDSSVNISAYTIYSNYLAGNVVTEFGAYDGASLSMSAKSQLAFGLDESSSNSGTSIGSSTVTADGAGSTVTLYSGTYILTNWYTADTFTSNFVASNGGSLSLEVPDSGGIYFGYWTASGDINIEATGDGSKLSISAGTTKDTAGEIYFGYAAEEGSSTVTADGGTVEIYARNLYVGYQTSNVSSTFTAKNGGTLNIETTNQVLLGYYSYKSASTNRTITVEATGSGSVVDIATGIFLTNWDTTSDCTTNIKATDGGELYIEASSSVYFGYTTGSHAGYTSTGTINISATGDGSLVDISAKSYIYFNGFEQSDLAVNISASDGGALIFSGTQVQFCANTKVTITSGGTLSTTATLFENTSSFSLDATSYWLSNGVATVDEGATLKLNGRVEVTTAISNSGTITVSKNSSLFVLSDALQDEKDENTYIVITTAQDSVETWHDLTAANFIFDNGSNLGRSKVDVSKDGVVTITDYKESATLIWDGVDGLHEWDLQESNDWKNGPQNDVFYTGDNVIFNEVAENKDVLINQNLVAGTITVEVSDDADEGTTADYTFDFDNNASLTGKSLTVGEDTSLTVTGDGSLNISSKLDGGTGETDIAGDMTVTGGANVSLEDVTVEDTGSLSVEDGSVTIAGNEDTSTTGDFTVHGSLDVSGGSLTADNLTLSKGDESEDGASAEFSGGETTIDGKVTVDSDSTLTVDGGTLNASELEIYSDDNADFSSGNLNIGSLTVTDNGGVTFGDGLTVGAYDDTGLDLDLDINLDGSVGFDTSNGDIEIDGTISDGTDEGSLTKTGSGTLKLDGENTYTGGTTIDEGTIEADNTDALGTGEVDIHKGATLKIHSDDSSDTPDEFTNATTGEGTLEIVDGDISLGEVGVQNVIVDSGATLDGDTTLTHSDASLDLKGTLEISVDNEEHITISDSGTVILEDTSTLVLDDADGLGAGSSFVIVDGGTVTGDIDSFLATDGTLLDLSNDYAVIYDTSNGLSVSIENTGTRSIPNMRLHDGLYSDFINAVITAEDMTIVAGIQGTGDVSSNPIARELLNGNVSRAVEMLNTLAPNDYAAMIAMPTTAYHNDISSLDKRLAAVRAMPFSEDENARWGYFAQADGTFAENDDANDTPTFDFQLYGVLAGADYRMSNTLTVGVALGYDHEHAKLHNSGGRIDGDDVRLTIYAGTQITDLVYANVGAQIGYGHYEARRHTVMGRASGETDGYNAGVFADVGMDLPLSEKHGISARPYVGLAYLRSFVSGFDDSLFDIGSFNNDSLMARVGLGVFWDLGGVSLGIDTSFTHDFCGEEIDDMSATYRATGSKFYMMAECLPEDVFSVGPVVSVGISEGISAFAGYSFQAGSNEYIGHNVYIGVRANF